MKKKFLTVTSLMVLVAAPAFSTGIGTEWKDITYDRGQCLVHATQALGAAGLTTNVGQAGESAWGATGQWTGLVRCATERHIAFIAVAGPNANDAHNMAETIKNAL
jgi:hypothetical protein